MSFPPESGQPDPAPVPPHRTPVQDERQKARKQPKRAPKWDENRAPDDIWPVHSPDTD